MSELAKPDFIKTSQADILTAYVKNYELVSGKKLQPAQIEQLLINSGSYMLYLNALRIQSAAEQNLPQFATYPALDLLAKGAGVIRIPAKPASCQLLLTLVAGHGNLIIPAGIRVQSQDGLATFVIQSNTIVAPAENSKTVDAVCDTEGVIGNGYVAGKISVMLDPQAYLSTASNVAITAGGSDTETDDQLRERFYLAPNSYSTAGSKNSYLYHAKSASPLILDVAINNGGGGVVNIYPLVNGTVTPAEILNAVLAACNSEKVRPLTDTVNVFSPTIVNYAVNVSLIVYASADSIAVQAAAVAALTKLTGDNNKKLGIDVILTQLIAAASVPGVAKVILNSPVADVVLDNTQVGICTGVTVAVTGTNNDK